MKKKTTFLYVNLTPPAGNVIGISFCTGLQLSREKYFLNNVIFSAIIIIPATNTLRPIEGFSGEMVFPPTMPLIAPDKVNLDPNTVVNTFQLIEYQTGGNQSPITIPVNLVIDPDVLIGVGVTIWSPGITVTDQIFARAIIEWEDFPN